MPFIGTKFTKEHKKKLSEAHKGKPRSEETKRKIGLTKQRKKIIPWTKGKHHSEKTKKKLSQLRKGKERPYFSGEKHPNWQGGISFEPYGLEFNEDLKEVIRNRDRRKCVICEQTELENKMKLSIHHMDYDKQNNNPNNLISLCKHCHQKTNFNREYWIKYFSFRTLEVGGGLK